MAVWSLWYWVKAGYRTQRALVISVTSNRGSNGEKKEAFKSCRSDHSLKMTFPGARPLDSGQAGQWILEMRRVSFGHSTLEQLQEPRRLMDEVYASLRKQSPNLPPQTEVREKLIGLKTK